MLQDDNKSFFLCFETRSRNDDLASFIKRADDDDCDDDDDNGDNDYGDGHIRG